MLPRYRLVEIIPETKPERDTSTASRAATCSGTVPSPRPLPTPKSAAMIARDAIAMR
jgi:hypothetical protein